MFVHEDYFETVIFALPSFVRPEGIDTLAFVAHQEEGKWDKLKKLNMLLACFTNKQKITSVIAISSLE